MAVLCLFTFSIFLNDAVLEPYDAAVFGMSLCATTVLNASLAIGFFIGIDLSGFQLIERIGNIRATQLGAVLAVIALALLVLAAPIQSRHLLLIAVDLFSFALGICMNACLTLISTSCSQLRPVACWGSGELDMLTLAVLLQSVVVFYSPY